MTVRYALHPGPVTSRTDGDRHFVDARRLAQLYGVSPSECVVVPWEVKDERQHAQLLQRIRLMDLDHLYPRSDGRYYTLGRGST